MGDLSENFSRHEFMCRDKAGNPCPHCGGIVKADESLLIGLERLRKVLGNRVITVNCGHRCTLCNIDAGGSEQSQHLVGKAADIVVAGFTPEEVAFIASREVNVFTQGGIGVYDWGVHVDSRRGRARFGKDFMQTDDEELYRKIKRE